MRPNDAVLSAVWIEIATDRDRLRETLVSGAAKDFDEYRFLTGQAQALDRALQSIEEMDEKIRKGSQPTG